MKRIGKRILSSIIDWKESLISLPLVIAIWLLSPYILTDPNDVNAPAGWGLIYLQKVLFGVAMVFVASTISWVAIRVHRYEVFNLSNTDNKEAESLTIWQKHLLVFFWFALFSLVFAIALNSL